MSLRKQRNDTREAILEGRFITHVLKKVGDDMNADIDKRISGFSSSFWVDKTMTTNKNVLTYRHQREHRFIDMRSRKSLRGNRRKRFYAIHNRPIYGHANEIVKELTVGFTDGVREQMKQMDGQQI